MAGSPTIGRNLLRSCNVGRFLQNVTGRFHCFGDGAGRRLPATPLLRRPGKRTVLKFIGFEWRWASAHFLFVKPFTDREAWLRTTLSGLGYELVDLETSRSGLLRVFIDSAKGINVEDCARVSHHLTRAFAVEGIEYERLEVSSPGLDRPLKRIEDYRRFVGRDATIKLKLPRDGRRRFEGRLAGVEDGNVVVEIEGERQLLAFEDIDRARLVPDL